MGKYNDYTGGQVEAVINNMGGFENWKRFAGGHGKVVFETILTLLRTLKIAAQAATTTSNEYFMEAGVVLTGTNFETQFYSLEIEAVAEGELAVRKLMQDSLDALILAELGDKAEILVAQFHSFLAANRGSEEWFIFYLRGKDGNIWAVRAYWHAGCGGWSVGARSVDDTDRWYAGDQVLSQV